MYKISEPLQKEIEGYAQKHQPEIEWDYRDELSPEWIEKIISGPDGVYEVENEIDELNFDYQWDLKKYFRKKLKEQFKPQLKAELGKEWKAELKQFIEDNSLDSVDPNLKGLMRNTGDQVFFYDTGIELSGYGNTPAQYRLDRIRIKHNLEIHDSTHDNAIREMQYNASYGGKLVIYFNFGINELLDIFKLEGGNTIQFTNACIAIIDTGNGSGHDTSLPKHTFKLPFVRENLFYERTIHYNYTYAVCGMSSDWCESTQVELLAEEPTGTIEPSPLNAAQDQQRKYAQTYKAGKCTFGDMDITRHRHTIYINDFPCGNRCTDCHTFWID